MKTCKIYSAHICPFLSLGGKKKKMSQFHHSEASRTTQGFQGRFPPRGLSVHPGSWGHAFLKGMVRSSGQPPRISPSDPNLTSLWPVSEFCFRHLPQRPGTGYNVWQNLFPVTYRKPVTITTKFPCSTRGADHHVPSPQGSKSAIPSPRPHSLVAFLNLEHGPQPRLPWGFYW